MKYALLCLILVAGCYKAHTVVINHTPEQTQYQKNAIVWEQKYSDLRKTLYDEAMCIKNHKGEFDPCKKLDDKREAGFHWLNNNYPYPEEWHTFTNRSGRMMNLVGCEFELVDSVYWYGFNPPIGNDPSVKVHNCYTYGNEEGHK